MKTCPICNGTVTEEYKTQTLTYKGLSIDIEQYKFWQCSGPCNESFTDEPFMKTIEHKIKDLHRRGDEQTGS